MMEQINRIPSPVSEEGIFLSVEAKKAEDLRSIQEANLAAMGLLHAKELSVEK